MIEIIITLLIGLIIGLIAGLTPGLHPNTLIPMMLPLALIISPLSFGILAVSVSISSNFFEFIKTIYFSAPDEGSIMAAQPAHELLLDGRGLEAIKLLGIGALGAVFLTSIIMLPLYFIIPLVYSYVKGYVPILLILISIHFILREKKRMGWAALIFVVSGVIGLIVLRNNLMNEPLLAILTGFYGASILTENIGKNTQIPGQLRKVVVDIDKKTAIKGIIKAILATSIITIVPAVGPSQASLIANEASKTKNKREYLITIGGVNTADVIYSIIALITINKARSGMIELVKQNTQLIMNEYLILILCTIITGIISYFLLIKIAGTINKKISSINYSKFSMITLVFIGILVTVINGFLGLLVFGICTIIGRITNKKKINKSHMLASLVIPTISYYL